MTRLLPKVVHGKAASCLTAGGGRKAVDVGHVRVPVGWLPARMLCAPVTRTTRR